MLVYLSTRTGVAALTPSHVYESIATLAEPDEAERLARLWDNMQLDAFPSLWSALTTPAPGRRAGSPG